MELRRSSQRGQTDLAWLQSRHSFSFGSYRDPEQNGFSDLLVINEDRVREGKGFGTHAHSDMEIFSYVLEGRLEHRDSMGNTAVIWPCDVQIMSAGTGIEHSEYNPALDCVVHFLQIWIVPNQLGVVPRYQQRHFPEAGRRGRLQLIIAPDGVEQVLSVYQDVRVYAGLFDGQDTDRLLLPDNRYAYVHVARGTVEVNGCQLEAGDGARLRNEREIVIRKGTESEVLVFDLRPRERAEQ